MPDMTTISQSRDCGNSPKNRFAEQIAIALEIGDTGFLTDVLDEGVTWEAASGEVTGCDQVLAQVKKTRKPKGLSIDHVVTHGKAGAVNGVLELDSAGRFCHVLTFTNTKCQTLQRITSFSD